jgi:hypothetical protein
MKKAKFLITILTIAIMLLGVGYAWFTDTLTIAGTVATATFDVDFEDTTVAAVSDYVDAEKVSADEDDIVFTVDKLYPGAIIKVDTGIKNKSNIPVKLESATVEIVSARLEEQALEDLYTYLEGASTNEGSAYKPIETFMNDTELLTLDSNSTQDYNLFLKLSENAGNEYQGKSFTITFTYNWIQVNKT